MPWRTAMLTAWQAHRAAMAAVSAAYPQTPPRSVAGHPALKCVRIASHHCRMSYTLRVEDQHAWLLLADPLHPICKMGYFAVLGLLRSPVQHGDLYSCRFSHSISSLIGSINIMIFSVFLNKKEKAGCQHGILREGMGDVHLQ